VLCSSQDHIGTGTRDLDHPIFVGAKNTNSWHTKKGDLQLAFPRDVSMVPSPKLPFGANGNNPTSVGLALCSTIHFGSVEFIVDCLGRLSLYPQEWDSSDIFVGMAHNTSPSLCTALEDSSNEDRATSGTGGSSRFPSPSGSNCDVPPLNKDGWS
jgi:hypothetical protein